MSRTRIPHKDKLFSIVYKHKTGNSGIINEYLTNCSYKKAKNVIKDLSIDYTNLKFRIINTDNRIKVMRAKEWPADVKYYE